MTNGLLCNHLIILFHFISALENSRYEFGEGLAMNFLVLHHQIHYKGVMRNLNG